MERGKFDVGLFKVFSSSGILSGFRVKDFGKECYVVL